MTVSQSFCFVPSAAVLTKSVCFIVEKFKLFYFVSHNSVELRRCLVEESSHVHISRAKKKVDFHFSTSLLCFQSLSAPLSC